MRKGKLHWLVLAMALVLGVGTASAQRRAQAVSDVLETVVTMRVDGQLTIDPQGRVSDYRIDTPLVDALSQSLGRAVRTWTFRPVLADGVATRATATMRVSLVAVESEGKYRVKIDNVIFPGEVTRPAEGSAPPKEIAGRALTPPHYPVGLMRSGVTGIVLLAIQVDEQGKAAQVNSVQTMLYDVSGKARTLQLAVGILENNAVDAARHWTFSLPADFAQRPAAQRVVMIPVEYTLDRTPSSGKGPWRTVIRTPRRDIAWLHDKAGQQRVGAADVGQGEMISLASAFSLTDNVIGSAL
jgi:hypothetical protein